MKAKIAAGLIIGGVALAACSSSSSPGRSTVNQGQPTPSATTGTSTTARNANGCTTPPPLTTTPQTNNYPAPPPLTIARTTYTAKIVTNCGTITVALNGKKAPHTVNSFAFLAKKGYFTDTPCHRLTVPPASIFVLQCGDPTGTGNGGPGYTIPDEHLQGATYPAGTVAMANAGPNTGGSQFFIVYRNATSPLHASYTPFGKVISGLAVVKRIAKAGNTSTPGPGDGRPNQPVVIESFTVTKG